MKIRVSSAYVCFVIGVLLVGVLTLIEVPCPIDGGTGVITGAKGLKVTRVEGELVRYEFVSLGCGYPWNEFTYALNISVVNESTDPSYGAVVVAFHFPKSEQTIFAEPSLRGGGTTEVPESPIEVLEFLTEAPGNPPEERIPIFVEIPAETAENVERIVVFEGFYLYGKPHWIFVEIADEIVCPYCGGAGKVPITEWLWIKADVQ